MIIYIYRLLPVVVGSVVMISKNIRSYKYHPFLDKFYNVLKILKTPFGTFTSKKPFHWYKLWDGN